MCARVCEHVGVCMRFCTHARLSSLSPSPSPYRDRLHARCRAKTLCAAPIVLPNAPPNAENTLPPTLACRMIALPASAAAATPAAIIKADACSAARTSKGAVRQADASAADPTQTVAGGWASACTARCRRRGRRRACTAGASSAIWSRLGVGASTPSPCAEGAVRQLGRVSTPSTPSTRTEIRFSPSLPLRLCLDSGQNSTKSSI